MSDARCEARPSPGKHARMAMAMRELNPLRGTLKNPAAKQTRHVMLMLMVYDDDDDDDGCNKTKVVVMGPQPNSPVCGAPITILKMNITARSGCP